MDTLASARALWSRSIASGVRTGLMVVGRRTNVVCVCVFVCLCVCVWGYIYICMYTHGYMHTHTHTHTHTHSHTHTQEFHSETLDTDVDVSNLAKKGKLANSDAEDYFFFSRGAVPQWNRLPGFVVGRYFF